MNLSTLYTASTYRLSDVVYSTISADRAILCCYLAVRPSVCLSVLSFSQSVSVLHCILFVTYMHTQPTEEGSSAVDTVDGESGLEVRQGEGGAGREGERGIGWSNICFVLLSQLAVVCSFYWLSSPVIRESGKSKHNRQHTCAVVCHCLPAGTAVLM